jgi:hypothetical protein
MTELPATGGPDVHAVRFPVATPPASVGVLIVGAGPVGHAATDEPTTRGVRATAVDRACNATSVRAGAMGHTPRVVQRGTHLPGAGAGAVLDRVLGHLHAAAPHTRVLTPVPAGTAARHRKGSTP